jgi:integrase
MATARIRLTKEYVKRLRAPGAVPNPRVAPAEKGNSPEGESDDRGGPSLRVFDSACPGFGVRVKASGVKTFFIRYSRDGRRQAHSIGRFSEKPGEKWSVEDARAEAQRLLIELKRDPNFRPAPKATGDTFSDVMGSYIKNYATGRFRSVEETERIFKKYVEPDWGNIRVKSLTRSDVSTLLDKIAEKNGPAMAFRTLEAVRSLFVWHETRSSDFVSPVSRGLAKTMTRPNKRNRVLSDDEIRAVWSACPEIKSKRKVNKDTGIETRYIPAGTIYGALIKLLLLTAARRDEIAAGKWDEINFEAGIWTVPPQRVKKTKRDTDPPPHKIPLTDKAREILRALHELHLGDYVITTTGDAPFSGFSKAKRAFDKTCPGLPRWTLHDLRRTARTLLSRAGVPNDDAERCLAHVLTGVRGVYDRHDYTPAVRTALTVLALTVEAILNPPPGGKDALDTAIKAIGARFYRAPAPEGDNVINFPIQRSA